MRLRYSGLFVLVLFSIVVFGVSLASAKIYTNNPTQPTYDPTATALATEGGPLLSVSGDVNPLTPGLLSSAECVNFDDNPPLNGGYLFIPPDPYCAAGLEHILNTVNLIVEWRLKGALANVPQVKMSMDALFAGTPGMLAPTVPSNLFDPKCIYDQYSNRFIVVALQRVTSPALNSRILIAVSKTPDPNAGWWRHAINSLTPIGATNYWADYPGIAIDDDAIYVTANLFNAAGTVYGGSRVWVIQKAPTYAGPDGSIVQAAYDPYALSGASVDLGVGTTTMPTHMYGPEPAGVGTFLVSTGWSDGVTEFVAVIRLDNPTGVVAWNYQLLSVGDISSGTVPTATQLGTARTIATLPQRCMNAVWRNNNLYTVHTIKPTAGVDLTQATAHWYRIGTLLLPALVVADQGNIGGEDLGAGTHTWIPQVMVDVCDNMAVGFSASNPAIYAGAYYATRLPSDAPGTIGGTMPLALGTDWYVRTFSTSLTAASRWGDFSGLSLCPVDQATFWVYNEYACTRGTPTGTTVVEDGRWCTRVGSFFQCQPVSVAITSFDAISDHGFVTLRSAFRSDLGVEAVNVYRAGTDTAFRLIESVSTGGSSFVYTDKTVQPGETYRYQIGVRDADGEVFSPVAEISLAGVSVLLMQNQPNPFNPSTTISFTLPAREAVTVSIYDANGRLVRTLLNETRDYGTHDVTWDGRDDAGSTVGSGVYFYRLTAGNHSESKKMVMLK